MLYRPRPLHSCQLEPRWFSTGAGSMRLPDHHADRECVADSTLAWRGIHPPGGEENFPGNNATRWLLE